MIRKITKKDFSKATNGVLIKADVVLKGDILKDKNYKIEIVNVSQGWLVIEINKVSESGE